MSAPFQPGEDDDAGCGRCGKPGEEDVIWSPAWRESLCLVCRSAATDTELRMTLAQKQALDTRAAEAS